MSIAESMKIFYNPRKTFEALPNRKLVPLSMVMYALAGLNGILAFHVLVEGESPQLIEYAISFVTAMLIPPMAILAIKVLFVGRESYVLNIANVYFHSFMPKITITTAIFAALAVAPQLAHVTFFNVITNLIMVTLMIVSIALLIYGITRTKEQYNVSET